MTATVITSNSSGAITVGSTGPVGPATSVENLPAIVHFAEESAARTSQEQIQLTEARIEAQLKREQIEKAAVYKYRNSKEFKTFFDTKVLDRVQEILEIRKANELEHRKIVETKLLLESTLISQTLQTSLAQERYVDINMSISTLSDYLEYEKFLEYRTVLLWECRGSVADICREYREELRIGDKVLPAIRQGILYNMAAAGQPTQYVSAYQAATEGEYSNAFYEYSEEMFLQYKDKDPFMLFALRADLPDSLTEIEKDNHISNKYPNKFFDLYLDSQSEDRTGIEVLTPHGPQALAPSGLEPLEVCHYPTYQTEYNSTRLALQQDTGEMQCLSSTQAWRIIRKALETHDLTSESQSSATQEQLAKGIENAISDVVNKFVHHLYEFFSGLIQVRITAECINTNFWFSNFFGMDNPLGKPPRKDKFAKSGEDNYAYSSGFDHSLELQTSRYNMTRVPAFHYRTQFLCTTLFILFGQVTDAYNAIMTLYSTRFSELIKHNWNGAGAPPELPRTLECYYTLSGALGFLAHNAAREARNKAITNLQPVIDDLFRQLLTTAVYNKGPLSANSLDLYPSPEATTHIEHKLREKAQRTQVSSKGPTTPVLVTSQPKPVVSLPPELAAVSRVSSVNRYSGIPDKGITPRTPRQALETSVNSGRQSGTVGYDLYDILSINNQVTNNMPVYMSPLLPCPAHIGNQSIGEQHFVFVNSRDGCSLGTGSSAMEFPQSSSEYPTRVPQAGGRPVSRGLATVIDGRRLQLRELRHETEEEEQGAARATRIQHESPQQRGLCRYQEGSTAEDEGQEKETTGGKVTPLTLQPQRRTRRTRRKGRRRTRKHQDCDTVHSTYPSELTLTEDLSFPNDMLSMCVDTLNVMSPGAMSYDYHATPLSNDLLFDNVTNITVPPVTHTEPPPQPNLRLAALTAPIANIGVNNISSYTPSVDELRILALGLNFIPEPKDITNFEIYQALDEYTDSLRWKEQLDYTGSFAHRDTSNSDVAQLRRKLRTKLYHKRNTSETDYKSKEHGYMKSFETNEYIHTIHERLKRDISNKRTKTHHTLSTQDSQDIQAILWDLKNNQMIVIKPADKNLGPTIMDRQWYIEAGELILKDNTTYRSIESFDINSIRNELIFILATSNQVRFKDTTPINFMYKDWRNESLKILKHRYITYTSDLADILLEPFANPDTIHPCRSYFLPKLQKLEIPYPCPPPFIPGKSPPVRPICASIGWVTYIVSLYLDIILKLLMLALPSYIMNSAALAKHLDTRQFPSNCSLLAADVESLYPSIDINRGLDALTAALKANNTDRDTRHFIVQLTRWVLMNNVTEFNGKLYIQICGTAMGTPCAVVFACIFMGTIERKAWAILSQVDIYPILNYRFIDDLLIIVNSSEDAQKVLDTFNNIDPFITLTGNISDDTANFLDLTLFKGSKFHHGQRFDLDVYQKPSNLFLFLPPCSSHPEHVFKGWIQGYISRLRINCTDDIIYHLRRNQFWDQLLARGYAELDLSDYFEHNPKRSILIAKIIMIPTEQNEPSSLTFFKIRHSTRTNALKPIIKKALTASPAMLVNPSLAKQLNNGTPKLAIRSSANFGKKLITAKLH
jgi:hypothetical protein